MTHPAWKRAYALKALRLRRSITDKQLAKRLGVSRDTLNDWLYPRRRK